MMVGRGGYCPQIVSPYSAVIIDDAEDIRALVRIRLGMGGAFEVVAEGSTGLHAIDLAREHQPDVLLLDISMPEMDGLEAIEHVRSVSPGTRIVVFSGFEEQGLAERALERGAVDFISKGRSLATLSARLVAICDGEETTRRRAAEEELRRSEDRFRLLVDSVTDYAIYMLDADGNVASWNLGAERTKGYGAEDVVGRYYGIFHTEEDQARGHPEEELRLAAEHGRFEEEGWRVRKDGSRFWADVTVTPVRDRGGAVVGFAKVTRDISERRRIKEQQEQVARDRTEFLAVTAHELRSPVALISGFASTLRSHWDELDEGQREEMLETLDRNGRRLGRLVDDLLVASRIEAGGLDVRPLPIVLRRVVDEVVADASAGGVDIAVEVDPELLVVADAIRLQQMLDNYLANAVRYGQPPIVVSTETVDGGVLIEVSDRGPGVPPALVPRLFGKFVRGNADRGTGLGLFIVRALARAHGGDAWYEARPDGGACFTIRLPVA
jgi:PAS domain S-box-containing protein